MTRDQQAVINIPNITDVVEEQSWFLTPFYQESKKKQVILTIATKKSTKFLDK